MNKKITNFVCSQSNNIVEWDCDGVSIRKKFDVDIFSEHLKGFNGVVVVYRSKTKGSNNAELFNSDGSSCKILKNPISQNEGAFFTDLYYVKGDLNLIVSQSLGQIKCTINSSGEILNVRESK